MKAKIRKPVWLAVPVLLLLAALALVLLRPGGGDAVLSKARDFNYILITVDTLRADRIGCYGCADVETPIMDLFAERGVRFERCIAAAPLTLPAHTTIMTGTYPNYHGVRDNGGFLVPQEINTLAELMRGEGFATSAFVAAYVLDSKWGLNQGFDTYFDRFDLSKYKTISLGQVQRPGNEVMDQVLPWIEQHKQERFFSWIHLYDPHTPYEPPAPFDNLYSNRPYMGEIAFTDTQLARLWDYLENTGLSENTVLVFMADHGESLGEHDESTHGFFIYEAGVHVPLIVVTPFEDLHGLVRRRPVSQADILPTVLDLAGIPIPTPVQGHSLRPLMLDEDAPGEWTAYTETFYPRYHYGWSELKSLQDDRWKLIMAPELELYDLKEDPREERNLVDARPAEARRLVSRLEAFVAENSQNAYEMDYSHMDEATREKLAALGYIGTFTDASSLSGRLLGDPKQKIHVFNQLGQAKELSLQEEFDQAVDMISGIISEDPEVLDAYFTLGNTYFKWGKFQEALDSFAQVLDRKPDDAFTVINIANCHIRMNHLEEAKDFVQSRLELLAPDSQVFFILGNIHNFLKEYDEAAANYMRCIKLNAASASAYSALGGVYVIQEKLEDASEYLSKAMELNPKLLNVHYNFAQLQEAKGDMEGAIRAYLQELENIPHNFRASYNLSRLYRISGRIEQERTWLEKTLELNPLFPLSYFYLARIHLNQGSNYREAVDLVLKGLEQKPGPEDLPLGYFLLADLYNRLGDPTRSDEYARKGREARSAVTR